MSEAEHGCEASAPPPEGGDDGKRWYVVQVYASVEQQVAANLAARVRQFGMGGSFGAILVPTESVVEVKRGERTTKERPILPGYVLVKMDPGDKRAFELVRRTPRVRRFVSLEQGGDPGVLSAEDLRPIMEYAEGTAKAPSPSVSFSVGDNVRIMGGPFDGWAGNVEDVDQKNGRLKVLVPIFGRLAPIDLTYDQVRRDTV